jgi:hypothetical protein
MTKDQLKQLEKELWNAADNLRANSDLKSSEYSTLAASCCFRGTSIALVLLDQNRRDLIDRFVGLML